MRDRLASVTAIARGNPRAAIGLAVGAVVAVAALLFVLGGGDTPPPVAATTPTPSAVPAASPTTATPATAPGAPAATGSGSGVAPISVAGGGGGAAPSAVAPGPAASEARPAPVKPVAVDDAVAARTPADIQAAGRLLEGFLTDFRACSKKSSDVFFCMKGMPEEIKVEHILEREMGMVVSKQTQSGTVVRLSFRTGFECRLLDDGRDCDAWHVSERR